MVNKLRGELEINLASETYRTRLTIDGMVRLESQLDMGLIAFAQELSQGKCSVSQIIKVLTVAIRGGGNKIDEAKIKELVSEAGVAQSLAVVGEILTTALMGGQAEGNEVAAQNE
jgi:hypothetical protein